MTREDKARQLAEMVSSGKMTLNEALIGMNEWTEENPSELCLRRGVALAVRWYAEEHADASIVSFLLKHWDDPAQ